MVGHCVGGLARQVARRCLERKAVHRRICRNLQCRSCCHRPAFSRGDRGIVAALVDAIVAGNCDGLPGDGGEASKDLVESGGGKLVAGDGKGIFLAGGLDAGEGACAENVVEIT